MAQKNLTIEQLAEMTQQEFWHIKNTMVTKQDLRDVGSEMLSAIENPQRPDHGLKQSPISAIDAVQLATRLKVMEKQLSITS